MDIQEERKSADIVFRLVVYVWARRNTEDLERVTTMIQLTRLNNTLLIVNCDLIKFIENTPDTVITLISGEKLVVLEACAVVIERVIEYRRKTAPLRYSDSVPTRELDEKADTPRPFEG